MRRCPCGGPALPGSVVCELCKPLNMGQRIEKWNEMRLAERAARRAARAAQPEPDAPPAPQYAPARPPAGVNVSPFGAEFWS